MNWRVFIRKIYRFFIHIVTSLSQKPKLIVTYMYRHDLIHLPSIKVKWDGNIEIRQIGPNDISLLHEIWPVPLPKMHKRLQRGDKCYSVFLDGKIASYVWCQTSGWHRIQPAGRWMKILPGEVVFYHERVASWAQGRGVSPYCLVHVLKMFRQEGYHTAWVYTTSDNIASQKSKERSGWLLVGMYWALKVGQIYIPLPWTKKRML
jgi:predicted GNAT family acetyltransferase